MGRPSIPAEPSFNIQNGPPVGGGVEDADNTDEVWRRNVKDQEFGKAPHPPFTDSCKPGIARLYDRPQPRLVGQPGKALPRVDNETKCDVGTRFGEKIVGMAPEIAAGRPANAKPG